MATSGPPPYRDAVRADPAVPTDTAPSDGGAAVPALRRDVVDHSLARRALLREVLGGGLFATTGPSDVCDASVYLVRAAAELGTATERTCPICRRHALREVTWVFGDALGPMSGTARTPRQLAALAARRREFTGYDVEVCAGCGWNHLLRSFRAGEPQVTGG